MSFCEVFTGMQLAVIYSVWEFKQDWIFLAFRRLARNLCLAVTVISERWHFVVECAGRFSDYIYRHAYCGGHSRLRSCGTRQFTDFNILFSCMCFLSLINW